MAVELSKKDKPDAPPGAVPHPMMLKLRWYDKKYVDIEDHKNGQTLENVGVKKTMILYAHANQNLATNKYPLLNDEGTDMNARAKYIVG